MRHALYLLALTLPVGVALAFPWRGHVLGGLLFWVLIGGAGLAGGGGLASILAILWLAVGWPVGMLYCVLVAGGLRWLWRRLHDGRSV